MIITTIIFIIVLSLLVFIHELGHFISAKRAGVRVEEFGFGFPPRLAGIRKGDTIYSINWIPLGGFVKIKGETGENAKDEDSFANKKPWQRAIILSAGVIMNILLAWFLLSVGYAIGLPQVIGDSSPYARITDRKTQVIAIVEDSPAAAAGIEIGDTILAVDGKLFVDIDEFREYTGAREGMMFRMTVEHDGEEVMHELEPAYLEEVDRPGIGVALVETGIAHYPLWLAPIQGLQATYSLTVQIAGAFITLIRDLVVTREATVEFSGPIGIAVLTGRVAKAGFRYLLQFTAVLSINLAIINVLPIPALDGGRLMFLAIEKLRGRAISRRFEIAAHNLGFTALMILVLFITYRDVVRFGGPLWRSISVYFGG